MIIDSFTFELIGSLTFRVSSWAWIWSDKVGNDWLNEPINDLIKE